MLDIKLCTYASQIHKSQDLGISIFVYILKWLHDLMVE